MSESERQNTLAELADSKREVNILMEKLPIGSTTLTAQRRRKELEEKLLRIERAIETFSKKTVYIALWEQIKWYVDANKMLTFFILLIYI